MVNHLNKKEYQKWFSDLKNGIDAILKEYKITFTYKESNEICNRYEMELPYIGRYHISIESYKCAKIHGRGVKFFNIFSRFDDFRDNDNELAFGDRLNRYSGKYNFWVSFPEHDKLKENFFTSLRNILEISNKHKK